MNPVHPWLDADEVKRLSEQLLRRPPAQDIPAMESAAFGADFVGFTDPLPSSSAPTPPASIPLPSAPQTVATSANIPAAVSLQSPTAVSQSNPPPPGSHCTSFLERMGPFCKSMHSRFSARGLFLLDQAGDLLFDHGSQDAFHFLARSFAQAPQGPNHPPRHVHVRIGTGFFLEIISVDSPMGCLVFGAILPETLSPEAVQLVRQELLHAIQP